MKATIQKVECIHFGTSKDNAFPYTFIPSLVAHFSLFEVDLLKIKTSVCQVTSALNPTQKKLQHF